MKNELGRFGMGKGECGKRAESSKLKVEGRGWNRKWESFDFRFGILDCRIRRDKEYRQGRDWGKERSG